MLTHHYLLSLGFFGAPGLLLLASTSRIQNLSHLLVVLAAAVQFAVAVARIPQHDARKASARGEGVYERCQLRRAEEVLSAAVVARTGLGACWQANQELRARGRVVRDLRLPGIEVEAVAFAAVGPHKLVGRAVVVVIELDEEVVKLRVVDHVFHVGLGERTLWRTGDEVCVGAILGEEAAELVDQELVVCILAVLRNIISERPSEKYTSKPWRFQDFTKDWKTYRIGFNIKVPSVYETVAEGTRCTRRSTGIGV